MKDLKNYKYHFLVKHLDGKRECITGTVKRCSVFEVYEYVRRIELSPHLEVYSFLIELV